MMTVSLALKCLRLRILAILNAKFLYTDFHMNVLDLIYVIPVFAVTTAIDFHNTQHKLRNRHPSLCKQLYLIAESYSMTATVA